MYTDGWKYKILVKLLEGESYCEMRPKTMWSACLCLSTITRVVHNRALITWPITHKQTHTHCLTREYRRIEFQWEQLYPGWDHRTTVASYRWWMELPVRCGPAWFYRSSLQVFSPVDCLPDLPVCHSFHYKLPVCSSTDGHKECSCILMMQLFPLSNACN